jgi:hypothetical protein
MQICMGLEAWARSCHAHPSFEWGKSWKVETKNPRRKMEDGWQHYWLRNGRGTKDPSSIDHTSSQTVMWVCRNVNLALHTRLPSRVNSREKPKIIGVCCDTPMNLQLFFPDRKDCAWSYGQILSVRRSVIRLLLMRERREMLIRHFHNLKKPETIESH